MAERRRHQFAVAGPRSREVLSAVVGGRELSNAAFPFMAAGEATIAGVAGRLFRISFSGELAYELAVPASEAERVWSAVLEAGALDSHNVIGVEIHGELWAQPVPLEFLVRTEFDLETGKVQVADLLPPRVA